MFPCGNGLRDHKGRPRQKKIEPQQLGKQPFAQWKPPIGIRWFDAGLAALAFGTRRFQVWGHGRFLGPRGRSFGEMEVHMRLVIIGFAGFWWQAMDGHPSRLSAGAQNRQWVALRLGFLRGRDWCGRLLRDSLPAVAMAHCQRRQGGPHASRNNHAVCGQGRQQEQPEGKKKEQKSQRRGNGARGRRGGRKGLAMDRGRCKRLMGTGAGWGKPRASAPHVPGGPSSSTECWMDCWHCKRRPPPQATPLQRAGARHRGCCACQRPCLLWVQKFFFIWFG